MSPAYSLSNNTRVHVRDFATTTTRGLISGLVQQIDRRRKVEFTSLTFPWCKSDLFDTIQSNNPVFTGNFTIGSEEI
jgi:hypothetical protein